MSEPERRRKRPTVSCAQCRKRKVRCNREVPCSNCIRSKQDACVYESQPAHLQSSAPIQKSQPIMAKTLPLALLPQGPKIKHPSSIGSSNSNSTGHFSTSSPQNHHNPSMPSSLVSNTEAEAMKARIRQLEEQLAQITQSGLLKPSFKERPAGESVSEYHIDIHNDFVGDVHSVDRGTVHKTRLFGQSHWSHGVILFKDIFEQMDPYLQDPNFQVVRGMQKCKSLARIIKARRAPVWPAPPTMDLPPREVADRLVECYLQTTESLYRILHIPTFRKEYGALWLTGAGQNTAFLVQLKLVLAIGAASYDKEFSLRPSAVKWIYEAQTWASEPEFKSQLKLPYLQTCILLLVARETANVGGALIWSSAGALLRNAVYMGLHRDPTNLSKGSVFVHEMRRRLWNTILELCLQSSLLSGVPPMISLDEFDTRPPGNFDDEQLLSNNPVPRPEDQLTQTSIAIAFRLTFPVRLAITKSLNDLGPSSSYEKTLELDSELRQSHKVLSRTLQRLVGGFQSSDAQFEVRAVDFILQRYLISLHLPFFGPAMHKSTYAFSRKVCVESSIKIWGMVYPSSAVMATQLGEDPSQPPDTVLARFTRCGSGFFRIGAILASVIISAELRAQLLEDASLGPAPVRADLLSVLGEAKSWALQCMETGETNTKGYLLSSIIYAKIHALMQGIDDQSQMTEIYLKTAEEVEQKCETILEAILTTVPPAKVAIDSFNEMSLNSTPEFMEDWDFMIAGSQLNTDETDVMNWVFNNE
ncbi:hypothetical protein BX600DRAFT_548995 [Xylariales sp. PMI_506]|nr:hypothetical protein BX600DRAFT_548995 [Xylariales sp. PMI_506]